MANWKEIMIGHICQTKIFEKLSWVNIQEIVMGKLKDLMIFILGLIDEPDIRETLRVRGMNTNDSDDEKFILKSLLTTTSNSKAMV